MTLAESTAPWAFCKGLPYKTIAALELYATLVSVMLFTEPERAYSDATLSLTGSTDNAGNTFAVRKLMSTKFPLCVMVMELASQLEQRGLDLQLHWIPRESNQPADDLTNNCFDRFDPARRIDATAADLKWIVLPWLVAEASALFDQVAATKAALAAERSTTAGPEPGHGGQHAKRRKGPSMRTSDPW